MKFVHFADLHLDTKFDNLNGVNGMPEKRRLEQRKVLKEIIEYVELNNVDILLISGDLYEQKYIRKSSIEYINNLFKKIPNTQIFIAPGNHDPYLANSFYNTFNWNDNVHIFENQIEKIKLNGINIYGFGFNNYYCENSKIEEIKIENTKEINILVAHGSLDGGQEEYREYNPLSKSKLKKLGFDYIALGHIHKPYYNEEENQRIVYPGSPISFGFDELGKHGFIAGKITKEDIKLEFIETDKTQYIEETIDITNLFSNEDIIEKIQNLKLNYNNFYKIVLEGKRFFNINIEEISRLHGIENVIKIKDHTKTGIDINAISKENSIRGIFVKRMLERKEKEGLDEDFVEKTIELGLEVL